MVLEGQHGHEEGGHERAREKAKVEEIGGKDRKK